MSVLALVAQPDQRTGDQPAPGRNNPMSNSGNQKLKPTVYQPSALRVRVPSAQFIKQARGRV